MTIMTPIEGITAPARAGSETDGAIAASVIPEHDPLQPAVPVETFLPQDETPLLSSRRADGWSAANQRLFLECIAEGYGVEAATYRVGLSAASAYAFRRTAKGAAFALGWRAANLVARDAIAETLLVRALEGQVSTITRPNGDIVTRHHHDNGMAMRLLARLDRQLEAAPDADTRAARLVAQEFDAFLALVAKDEGPARAGLFLARRATELAPDGTDPHHDLAPIYALAAADRFARTGLATAGEVDVRDLDPATRADWTAEQWHRAEAAGLLALAVPPARETVPEPQHSQHSARSAEPGACSASGGEGSPQSTTLWGVHEPGRRVADPTRPTSGGSAMSPAWPLRSGGLQTGNGLGDDDPAPLDDDPVWWDEDAAEWRTSFPPAAGQDADFEEYDPGHHAYQRSLSEAEAALMGLDPDHYTDAELAELAAARDAYFAKLAAEAAAADPAALPAARNPPIMDYPPEPASAAPVADEPGPVTGDTPCRTATRSRR